LDILQRLRLSKSSQRESWALLSDLARIEKKAITEILREPAIADILGHPSLAPAQKQERLKQELTRRRYPMFAAATAAFEHLLRQARLPPAIQLRPTPYFADDILHLQMQFRSVEEYRVLVNTLQRLSDAGLIAQMVDLT
jgi:hypothetical protein